MSQLTTRRSSLFPSIWEDLFDLNNRYSADRSHYLPAMKVSSDDENIYVSAELPGIKKDHIEVEYDDGVLSITAEKREEEESKEKTIHHHDIRYGKYVRQVSVGDVSFEKANAVYSDGILNLTLPKSKKAQPRRLQVK